MAPVFTFYRVYYLENFISDYEPSKYRQHDYSTKEGAEQFIEFLFNNKHDYTFVGLYHRKIFVENYNDELFQTFEQIHLDKYPSM